MSFAAVLWPYGQASPAWLSRFVADLPDDWTGKMVGPNAFVAVGGRWPPPCQLFSWGVAIGDLYRRADLEAELPRARHARARALCARSWGQYVALFAGERGEAWSVLRDPSGALDALAWARDGALIVSADIPSFLQPWLPDGASIDWAGVAGLVAEPVRASADVALSGVHGLAPGEIWSPQTGATSVWTPAGAARRGAAPASQAGLREQVDAVVGAMSGEQVMIELSGGLDSAIVAGALCAQGKAPDLALNYYVQDLGGDERAFARAAAEHLGLELQAVEKPTPGFELEGLRQTAGRARPAFNALDYEHDRDVAARCLEQGLDTLVTGQGGDHIFFQAPSAHIAADAMGAGLTPRMLAVLAQRLGGSAWGILGQALKARMAPPPPPRRPAHLSPAAWSALDERPVHPWLADLAGLAPAKALQAASLAAALSLQGASRRGAAARLRHPLLSQPMMEYCLPIPIAELTMGGHDRAMARAAFAGRLPSEIVRRQGKGRLTSHYGRSVAAGLGELRPLLIEGRLAREGLLERAVLEEMLSLEALAWRGGFGVILQLAAIELWVQAWEGRSRRVLR